MRRFVVPLLALCALALPASALADTTPPTTQPAAPTLLPTPAPPTTPVTDEAGAGVFAKAFLIAHAGDLVPGAHAVTVDVPACRQVDSVQRFYCLATARVVQVQRIIVYRSVRRSHNRAHAAGDVPPNDGRNGHDGRDNRHNRRQRVILFRIRAFQCVAVVRIVGGPSVAPTATLPVRDCVRVSNGPTPTPLTAPDDTTDDTPAPY